MGALNPAYEREGDWVLHRYELPTGKTITLQAKDVRRERTGPHALVQIRLNRFMLAGDRFNVERDPERVRLSNSAMKMLPELDKASWEDAHMKHALDLFCTGLWEEHVGENAAELLEPSREYACVQLCGPYVIQDGGTIMFAPPGRGKSYTALAMAISMDSGCDEVWPVKQTPTLYVNLERNRESMRFRLGRINAALGLEQNRPLPFINARGKSLSDVYDSIRQAIERHECRALVLDSISRSGVGDLKEDTTGNRAIDLMNGLGVAWLALGHTPRSDENHIFGTVHFDAGMDIGVQLLRQMDRARMGIGLKVTKANDMAIPPVSIIALEWDGTGLSAIHRSSVREFPEIEGYKPPPVETIEDFLKMTGAMSATDIAAELGMARTVVARVLSADRRFMVVRREGHKVLYGVSIQHSSADF